MFNLGRTRLVIVDDDLRRLRKREQRMGREGEIVSASIGVTYWATSARAAQVLREWNGQLKPEFFASLWPQLAVVSAWDTAAAAPCARCRKCRAAMTPRPMSPAE